MSEHRLERVASYLLSAAQRERPYHWRQGKRQAPLEFASAGPASAYLAAQRVRGISELALRGLAVLGSDFPVELSERPVTASDILRAQARGGRVVTLLPETAPCPPPHTGALDFALHDLCHLAKFVEPAHFVEQVGFFRAVARAFASPLWQNEQHTLDQKWTSDRDSVCSDMNGSSVFLFSVLKMKLKMAARRRLAARTGSVAPTSGALSTEEAREFEALLRVFLDALELDADVHAAALETSARRDSPEAAIRLCQHFQRVARQLG